MHPNRIAVHVITHEERLEVRDGKVVRLEAGLRLGVDGDDFREAAVRVDDTAVS